MGWLPLMNTMNDLIDEGIIKGTVNWQLYGLENLDMNNTN